MASLIVLGSSSAIPAPDHDNTFLVLKGAVGCILIDCPHAPDVRLARVGITLDQIEGVVLTHFHPDHVSGVPQLLMNMWLRGRSKSLLVAGPQDCLDRILRMMDLYDWMDWPGLYPVERIGLPDREQFLALETSEFRVWSSPGKHIVPSVALRFESKIVGTVIVYSSDTEPSAEVVRLAQGADVLIHEATGETTGHSSAAQAGQIAQEAGAKQLYLIHYDPDKQDRKRMIHDANRSFDGQVFIAEDFTEIELEAM